jgi:TetR/AcrR family transcriptional repressor of nem operon
MGRPKSYEREQVLEKAMNLFWTKGYEGSHLDELVRVTGLNRFSLYREFGGKKGLFAEAFGKYLVDLRELGAMVGREPLGLQNLRDYFETVAEARFLHGCFMLNTMSEKNIVGLEIFTEIKKFMTDAESAFLANLKAAKKSGEISKKTDVEGLAKALIAFDMGVVMTNLLSATEKDKKQTVSFLDRLLQ